MGLGHHFDDADGAALVAGVVEKAEIALLSFCA